MDHSNGHAEVESASMPTTDAMAITTARIIRTKPDAKVAFIHYDVTDQFSDV